METVFEHNITKQEMKNLFMGEVEREWLEEYSQDTNYSWIVELYQIRKDIVNARKYLNMIPPSIHKAFTLCNDDIPHSNWVSFH